MPLYDFRCAACGARFERALPMSAATSTAACACGAVAARVQTGFTFGGRASAGDLDRRALPHSLRGVGFSRERVAALQRQEEAMSRREESNPELTQEHRVVIEHESGAVRYAATAPTDAAGKPAAASSTGSAS